eukprot:TRINITY_DN844_c0_g1_i1.p2 TRINITY_DN844_c0_g1~~TRINITY_DN844_c0_g1_i1.p2  ORF type:complete len:85 (+),score=22.22 TRINITY_DN844_c0_g1_i1:395-649(+)
MQRDDDPPHSGHSRTFYQERTPDVTEMETKTIEVHSYVEVDDINDTDDDSDGIDDTQDNVTDISSDYISYKNDESDEDQALLLE